MTEQATFLQPIDRKATQKKVEELLENVRLHRQFGMIRQEMKMTPAYEPRYHGTTHAVGDPAADVALQNVRQQQRDQWLAHMSKRVDAVLGRMGRMQREIINKRYLGETDQPDYIVYNELGMAERTFRRHRDKAIYHLAFALRLEVFEGDEQA
ncbi:ArpU family phage packaging/lysis transcriptional regulator [Ectobacillus ponti]|uniref:ArpU family transcriptional regulator n=1 Tax=Ectobacillus ponti TaxID=2961894 RepID=A0AA42BR42_9BACI|nr:ArpU family phage packaging/lysis transcriptional regulator [Ectobacillus ponti]MCP8970557.1 ArpU family transcriptional regulator [Ectobacillus ponti]